MHKLLSRAVIIALILFLALVKCHARKAPGYIVTHNADTLWGEIVIPTYNINSTGFSINGIDLEWFYLQVKFKEYNTQKSKIFKPDMINAFGFNDKSIDYIFESFTLESTSLFTQTFTTQRFLNLIYKGEVCLYRNFERVQNMARHDPYYNAQTSTTYYNYYLYKDDIGILIVDQSADYYTVHDLLYHFNVNPDFIKTINKKTRLRDIKIVLEQYDQWLFSREWKL